MLESKSISVRFVVERLELHPFRPSITAAARAGSGRNDSIMTDSVGLGVLGCDVDRDDRAPLLGHAVVGVVPDAVDRKRQAAIFGAVGEVASEGVAPRCPAVADGADGLGPPP